MPSMHSRPIRLTVSKRLKHVRLFKSNQRLTRLFRCIFHCVKNKKLGGKRFTSGRMCKSRQTWLVFKAVGPSWGVKETRRNAWVEWMNLCIMYSSSALSLPMNIDKNSTPCLHWRLNCITWSCWREWRWHGWIGWTEELKAWGLFSCTAMSGGHPAQLLVFHGAPGAGMWHQRLNFAEDHSYSLKLWVTNTTPVHSHFVSTPFFFSFFFCGDVTLCATTKWRTNPGARLASQNSS